MKRGKHLEKSTAPLFPRLHVNDTEKGGPRPPPRNKMALYEQLSIPSHRLSSRSASTLPLPPSNLSRLVHSGSSSLGGGRERNVIGPVHTTAPPDGFLKNIVQNSEKKSVTCLNCEIVNARGDLSPAANHNSFQPCNFSLFKSPLLKEHDDKFRVPTFLHAGKKLGSSSNQVDIGRERSNVLHINSSRLRSSGVTRFKRPSASDLELEEHERNLGGKAPNLSEVGEKCNRSPSNSAARDNISLDVFLKSLPENKVSRPYQASASSNRECKSCPADETDRLCNKASVELAKQGSEARGIAVIEQPKFLEKECASAMRSESCTNFSHVDQKKSPQGLVDDSRHGEEDICRNDDIPDTSTDRVLSSPDDIIRVIGQTHFWKARKAIINQQRLFSMQVFELHRLIKVQKAITGSLHLLEDGLILAKHLAEASPMKKLPKSGVQLPKPPPALKSGDEHLKTMTPVENSKEKPPLPAFSYDIGKAAHYRSSFAKPSPTSMGTDTNLAMWCFYPPPGNQWLVPVMSPSEGLVYKPYTGPCPPSMGFMAPFCGGCGPLAATPAGSGSLYHGPASHQHGMEFLPGTPLFQSYFAPYSMSAVNSSLPPGVQLVTAMAGGCTASDETQLLLQDSNFIMPNQSSCNNRHCGNEVVRGKDTELQGSTASSSPERIQNDALPLFPMMPAAQDSEQMDLTYSSGQQKRAVKAVPHNSRLAAESAARIFQFIQQERK